MLCVKICQHIDVCVVGYHVECVNIYTCMLCVKIYLHIEVCVVC